jgi:hypothetical protein
MAGLARRGRVGLVAVTAIAATMASLLAAQPQTPTAEAVECFERSVGAPINESGIQCPGETSVWKSYTFASSGIGYYTETEETPDGHAQVRLGYQHQDGRTAISLLECGNVGCEESYWNGVPFPFGH